jgi:hypothetical protein
MRFMPASLKIIVLFVLVVGAEVSPGWATSIPIKGASSYGQTPSVFGSGASGTFTGGSFSEETICPSNDPSAPNACNLAYVFTFSVTPPAGSQSLTIDFPSATSGVNLSLLFCDATTAIPCTVSSGPFSGSLGPDGTTGQAFAFTDLSQLQNQKISLIFVDSTQTALLDANGDPVPVTPNIPTFSTTWGTSSVATPEPTCLALLGLGFAALSGKLRRKHS